jgi:hypothetical protein
MKFTGITGLIIFRQYRYPVPIGWFYLYDRPMVNHPKYYSIPINAREILEACYKETPRYESE